jgi:hypothetical protein
MLIRNYGRLWERRYVFWGRGSVKGHLRGYRTPTDEGSDFRDQIGIYILHDKNYQAVYVGQTGKGDQRLFVRLRQHQQDHLWNRWEYFSWFGFRRVNESGDRKLSEHDHPEKKYGGEVDALLNEIEGALLVALEPKLNKQGPRWKDVKEYFQVVESELEDRATSEVLQRINDLEKVIGKIKVSK